MSHEDWPDLTNDLDILGHNDSVSDHVGTVVKEHNLVRLGAIKHLLNSLGVVGLAVTLGTSGAYANERRSGVFLVQGLRALKDLAVLVQESAGLGLRGKDSLHTSLGDSLLRALAVTVPMTMASADPNATVDTTGGRGGSSRSSSSKRRARHGGTAAFGHRRGSRSSAGRGVSNRSSNWFGAG